MASCDLHNLMRYSKKFQYTGIGMSAAWWTLSIFHSIKACCHYVNCSMHSIQIFHQRVYLTDFSSWATTHSTPYRQFFSMAYWRKDIMKALWLEILGFTKSTTAKLEFQHYWGGASLPYGTLWSFSMAGSWPFKVPLLKTATTGCLFKALVPKLEEAVWQLLT